MTPVTQLPDIFLHSALEFILRSSALAFLCASALWLLRVRNAAVRYAAWRLVLFAMLFLPIVGVVAPKIGIATRLAIPFASRVPKNLPSLSAYLNPQRATQFRNAPTETIPPVAETHRAAGPAISWALIALASWLLVSAIMICRIVSGWLLMHRTARRMKSLEDSRLLERANCQCERLGLLAFPEFRTGAAIAVPVTFGWKKPVILLPADWPQWPTEKLDLVLAHELSHIRRGDYVIRILSALNKSLYWFHPLSWWLDKRLAELCEHVSDDAALATGSIRRERYAEVLNDFAGLLDRSPSRFRLGIAMAVSALGNRRIKRVLDRRRSLCASLNLRQKVAICGLAIPVFVLIATAQTATTPSAAGIAPRQRRISSPLFSPVYIEALQDVATLEPQDAAALENRLSANPDDFSARLKLIAYSMRPDRANLPESRTRRADLVLWLFEHHPESEILGSPYAAFSSGDLTPDRLQRAQTLWIVATKTSTDARVMWNAANFYRQYDRRLYLASLEQAVALAPENENYAQALGLLYGGAILTIDPQSMYRDPGGADTALARHATEVLDTTPNAFLIEPAIRLLQSDYNRSQMMGKPDTSLGEMAARYFRRAKVLDPGLDDLWIYPKIDPKMIGMLAPAARPPEDGAAQFEAAAKQIRRLPPDAFPNLPAAIKAALRLRGCLIPQPAFNDVKHSNRPENVIEGEFFEKGKTGWAVLCSTNGSSSILVFRDASDRRPEEVATEKDEIRLQSEGDGKIVYSREIQPAGRKYIIEQAHGSGGPEPPPIDHQGINDEFLGAASGVYYRYRGKWQTLAGDD